MVVDRDEVPQGNVSTVGGTTQRLPLGSKSGTDSHFTMGSHRDAAENGQVGRCFLGFPILLTVAIDLSDYRADKSRKTYYLTWTRRVTPMAPWRHEGDLLVTMKPDLGKQSDTLGYPADVPLNPDVRRWSAQPWVSATILPKR